MNEKPSLFGSNGLCTVLGSFGRRGAGNAVDIGKTQPVFGKRAHSPCHSLSLQRARLSYLRSELHALFHDEAAPENAPSIMLTEGEAPQLLIGETAAVLIDGETGLFVFREETPYSGVIVVTASDERLIDHVICHLAAGPEATGTETANQAARRLVGQTLADVERRVILQTLRHCHGNRARTADMLGVSLRTIRNKLREYWRTSEAGGGQS
ncbi:helix-turn-helix domain-containing protein [Agrobacterium sp. LMR679]|uniref:helix-turn-helix domain-containing protein n=1 Tax=Agrobacterium sp. LMR679 TaxID=3014335 RepID=UPI003FA490E2